MCELSLKFVLYNVCVVIFFLVDLGLYKLSKNIACGEMIEVFMNVDGDESVNGWFIVNCVMMMYNFVCG